MINDTDNNMGGGDGVQQRAQPTILSPSTNTTTSITVVHSPRAGGDYYPSKKGDPTGPLSPSTSSLSLPPSSTSPPQWQAADWLLLLTMLLLVVGTVQVVAMGGFFSGGSGGKGDLLSFSHERIAKLESRASLLSDSVRNTTMDIGAIFEELRALENVPAYRAALEEARADASSSNGVSGANLLKTPKGKRAVEELNRLHQAAIKEVGRIHAMVMRAQKSYMDYYHEKEDDAS